MIWYDSNNPQTIGNQWSAFAVEFTEFLDAIRELNFTGVWDEFNDTIHSFLRFVISIPCSIPYIGRLLYSPHCSASAWLQNSAQARNAVQK
eukprot:6537152-Ditylum_brightwellii.AAC.1